MKNNLADLMCLDIYLSNLNNDEYSESELRIQTSNFNAMPLSSWDIYMESYHSSLIDAKKNSELKQVISLAKKFNWKNDLSLAFSENTYESLIITDLHQKIVWVNDGFSAMTGYSKKFAMNKTPKFLQGEKTSSATKNRIREKIALKKPFKEVIFNYKKDKTLYKCEVKIIPLYNERTTHYIAFEKEVI